MSTQELSSSQAVAPQLERWAGRVAVVTGASSGIGAAVARALAGAGMKVACFARRHDRLEALREQTEGGPGEVHPYEVDLRQVDALPGAFRQVASDLGGIDVLVNNAGLGHKAPLMSGPTEAWREMLEVNVLALCVCTREAVQDMVDRGVEGHILHMSSMAAHRVPPDSGVYSATKYAVRSLTEGLRQELWAAGAPIRVTSISPAFVETEFAAKYHRDPAAAEHSYGRYPVLQPEDLAHAVLYCLGQPLEVVVHDLLLRPRQQQS